MAQVTLSFDNGPHPVGTPRVLRELEARGLPAHFFAVGEALEAPGGLALARRIVEAGHALGNHSYSHGTPLGLDPRPDAVERELTRTQALLDSLGELPVTFRPRGGGGRVGPHLLSPAAVAWLEERRGSCVLWNVVPGDFRDPDGWVEAGLEAVEREAHALVVLHDAHPDAMRHLARFLDALLEAGHTPSRELPDACVPLREGRRRPELAAYVQRPPGPATHDSVSHDSHDPDSTHPDSPRRAWRKRGNPKT